MSAVEAVYPSESNFLLVKIRDAGMVYRELLDAGIVVRDRSHTPGCEGCLRITVGTAEENTRLIETLNHSGIR